MRRPLWPLEIGSLGAARRQPGRLLAIVGVPIAAVLAFTLITAVRVRLAHPQPSLAQSHHQATHKPHFSPGASLSPPILKAPPLLKVDLRGLAVRVELESRASRGE
jgi:hypothetical protein